MTQKYSGSATSAAPAAAAWRDQPRRGIAVAGQSGVETICTAAIFMPRIVLAPARRR